MRREQISDEELGAQDFDFEYLTDFGRTSSGELSEAALAEYERSWISTFEQDWNDIMDGGAVRVHGIDDAALGSLLAREPDYYAMYPELRTYLSSTDIVVTEDGVHGHRNPAELDSHVVDHPVGGHRNVRVTFHYADTDPMASTRQELVLRGLSTKAEAGRVLPERLDVYLPRYHRVLEVRSVVGPDGGLPALDITPSSVNEALPHDFGGMFSLPNTLIVTSSITSDLSLTTPDPEFQLSGRLHDSALGFTLHELGHWEAYHGDRRMFAETETTEFLPEDLEIVEEVSPYAASHVGEFLPEKLLGEDLGRDLGQELDDPRVVARIEALRDAIGGLGLQRVSDPARPPTASDAEIDSIVAALRDMPGHSDVSRDVVETIEPPEHTPIAPQEFEAFTAVGRAIAANVTKAVQIRRRDAPAPDRRAAGRGPRPRRGLSRASARRRSRARWRARSTASSPAFSARRTCCPPTSSAPTSTTSASSASSSGPVRCSPTWCWSTRSTAPRPRPSRACSSACRSAG